MDCYQAEMVTETTRSLLGEGPVWEAGEESLWWVDIEGKRLHRKRFPTGEEQSWNVDQRLGAAVPWGKNQWLLALETGLAKFNLDTEQLLPLNCLDSLQTGYRLNDGKCDRQGRFWIGSMHKEDQEKNRGTLYQVAVGSEIGNLECVPRLEQLGISNGLAWSHDQHTMYFIDSRSRQIDAFDFELATGAISNRRKAFEIPHDLGLPDGMAIDCQDHLWVAIWGGSCVLGIDPTCGEQIAKIDVPAPHVTSCAFGGPDLTQLFITTARNELSPADRQSYPGAGAVFVCEGVAPGAAVPPFAG